MKTIEQIFNQERTCLKFNGKKIDNNILKEIYDLMKMGPTSANLCPIRIIFVSSDEAKQKLMPTIMEGNKAKVESAPVIAIFAQDKKFYQHFKTLSPQKEGFAKMFESKPELIHDFILRNSSLQAAYFMIIARAYGLACGPMSGFNSSELDKIFLDGSSYESNFICCLGYAEGENPYTRLPRFDFDDVCKIV